MLLLCTGAEEGVVGKLQRQNGEGGGPAPATDGSPPACDAGDDATMLEGGPGCMTECQRRGSLRR